MAALGARRGSEKNAGPARRGIPLSLVIARYFAYAVAALAAVWLAALVALAMTLNAGVAYPANYGAAHAGEVAAALRARGSLDADLIPTAYRHVLLDAAGEVAGGDLADAALEDALDATRAAREGASGGDEPETLGSAGVTYVVVPLSDGTTCVLASEYLPQYVSRELRDALPNPQDLMLVAGCAGSLAAVALVARRASRVLTRKMAPLAEAAGRIAREDLDFSVGTSNVRQIADVLAAMERMRAALAESLEARWRAERAQREQLAALAHDLRTPLTVVRANADFVAEELGELAGGAAEDTAGPDRLADAAAAALDASRAAERLDAHVRLLIETSRGQAAASARATVGTRELFGALAREAGALARARGTALSVEGDASLEGASVTVSADAVGRAVANVVSNALDHARGRVALTGRVRDGALEVEVTDDGAGFSPAALEHGRERFFRDDAARGGAAAGAHYGIGLAVADDVARAHGGSLLLANRTGEGGRALGARVTLTLPAREGAAPGAAGPSRPPKPRT